MSSRRDARGAGKVRAAKAGEMPAALMTGPCIEVWANQKSARPSWASSSSPSFEARRNWAKAVDAWAVASGWAGERRPASNARNLARTRIPWSRVYLLGQGRKSLVDFYEGRRATHPPTTQWERKS